MSATPLEANRSRGLGRGLDSLIAAAPEQRHAPIEAISPNPSQPRTDFDAGQLAELAASIRAHGILQPLLVRPEQMGRYELIAGERRWRAAQTAGLSTVPIMVQDDANSDAAERLSLALVENIQRSDLNPIEQASAFAQLADGGWTQERIASQVGKSRAAVANLLRLLRLPDALRESVARGELSEGHGRALVGLAPPEQTRLARRTVAEGWTVRRLEAEVVALKQRRRPAQRAEANVSPVVRRARNRLQSALADRVDVQVSPRGVEHGGRIIVRWRDEDELQSLVAQISGASDHSDAGGG